MASPAQDVDNQSQVIAEHLPSGYTAEFDGHRPDAVNVSSSTSPPIQQPTEEAESSLKLQGGDIHRDLFRMDTRKPMHRRAATFHAPSDLYRDEEEGNLLTVGDQLAPGGFRRAFLQQRLGQDFLAARMPVTRNFVEFLELYGSFAGEDLADSDDEAVMDAEGEETEQRPGETRSLLGRRPTSRLARARPADSGTVKTFFTLLKAFIGTGIMFLPKAFNNGGILFSSLAMLCVSLVSMLAFHLLLECKRQYSGGYGEIGMAIGGHRMRFLILASITLSQLGFVCAGIVFVAENLLSFLDAVTKGHEAIASPALILVQLPLLIPLALIRNISKLGPAAMVADAFILVGIGYIYYFDISHLLTDGINKTVVLFNPDKYTLMIGSAIFTFEGIGLILPIQSSMAKPEHFERLLALIMLIITLIFTSVGALCYATFGEATKIEIINNYPQASAVVNIVQFLYAMAVLIGTPVQLFPALRILEGRMFGHRSGKRNAKMKWYKNMFRGGLTVLCIAIAIAGATNLDRFVALIGSFACVPLVYIYPPYLHYRGIATTKKARWGDLALMALGLVGMVYTTVVTLVNSFW